MNWLLGVILLLIGVLVGWITPGLRSLKLAPTVDVANVANVVVTLVVAATINVVYSREQSKKQAVTEVLREHYGDVKSGLAALMKTANDCSTSKKLSKEQQSHLISAERTFSNNLYSLEEAIKACRLHQRISCDNVKRAREDLKAALTDSPFPGPYANADLARMSRAANMVRDELTRLLVSIQTR